MWRNLGSGISPIAARTDRREVQGAFTEEDICPLNKKVTGASMFHLQVDRLVSEIYVQFNTNKVSSVLFSAFGLWALPGHQKV